MRLAKFGYWPSLLAVAQLLLPTPLPAAEPATPPRAVDVMLDAAGSLTGQVVGSQGQGIPARILLTAPGAQPWPLATDTQGRFRVTGLRGGIYQVALGGQAFVFRVWTAAAAPPGAQSAVLLVVDENVVRGQTPLPDFVRSDAFLITAVVVAAIAIPIAIHNFRNDHPNGS